MSGQILTTLLTDLIIDTHMMAYNGGIILKQ